MKTPYRLHIASALAITFGLAVSMMLFWSLNSASAAGLCWDGHGGECSTGETCCESCSGSSCVGSCNAVCADPIPPCDPLIEDCGGGDDDDYTPPPSDFTISLSPSYATVNRGQSATYTATVSTNESLYGQIILAITTCPAGASCSISPATISASPNGLYPAVVTVTTSNATPLGNNNLVVSGNHSSAMSAGIKYAGATLAVNSPPVRPTCSSTGPATAVAYGTSGSFYVYAYGVNNATQVYFPTWGEANGQEYPSDLYWYPGQNMGGGTWRAAIDLSRHKSGNPDYGTFITHVYMNNASYVNEWCGATTFQRQMPPPTGVTASCPAPGTSATLSWNAVPGYSHYYARFHDSTADQPYYPGPMIATSYTIPTTPGHRYYYWVHTTNSAGNPFSAEVPTAWTAFVDCPAPIPTPTNLTGSCPPPGTVATMSWTAPSGYNTFAPRLCDLTINPGCNPAAPGFWLNDSYNGTTWSISGLTPGHSFAAWVHTAGSPNAISTSFVCQAPAPVTGSCGSANKTYPATATGFGSDTFCGSGTLAGSPSFPAQGSSSNWTCRGANGGADASCSASRSLPAAPSPDLKTTVWASWIGTGRDTPWYYSNTDDAYAAYYAAPYALSWGAVANATSCTLDGSSVSVAGGSVNTYNAMGFAGYQRVHTLTCTGPGGTSSNSVTVGYPPPPTGLSGSCPAPGGTMNVSWTAPAGYNTFYVRAYDAAYATWPPAVFAHYDDAQVGTTDSFATEPGKSYKWYVHSRHPVNGAWSDSVWSSSDVVCGSPAAPAPDAKVTVWASWSGTGRDTPWVYSTADAAPGVYVGAPYAVTWGSVPNAASCTLDGSPVSKDGGSVNTYVADGFVGDTRTHALTCVGPGGTGTDTVTISYPPWPSNPIGNCPVPGTLGSVSWTAPAGYNTFYLRVQDNVTGLYPIYDDAKVGTSATFPATPGRSYGWWVHTREPSTGGWGHAISGTVSCSTVPVNAACGTADKMYSASATGYGSDTFCSTGSLSGAPPSFPAQGGTVMWTCNGVNGGTNATCSAERDMPPPAATCGTAAKTYVDTATSFGSDTFCGVGALSGSAPAFPNQGEGTTWTCAAPGGSAACFAYRDEPSGAQGFTLVADPTLIIGKKTGITGSYSQSKATQIRVVPYGGFTGQVTLSAFMLIGAAEPVINPDRVNSPGYTSTLFANIPGKAPNGTYEIIVTGTSGSRVATTSVWLDISDGLGGHY